ncbi:hypothetical protein LCGC14_0298300 [marine sediment metagenome]|uniref:Uncharacterized protein n=1 Tax=marine sediment metagenome TaxID=412755 RepID=A0A0F9TRA1_9ZZZZ
MIIELEQPKNLLCNDAPPIRVGYSIRLKPESNDDHRRCGAVINQLRQLGVNVRKSLRQADVSGLPPDHRWRRYEGDYASFAIDLGELPADSPTGDDNG